MVDRRRRDLKLSGGKPEAPEACNAFEGTKSAKGGKVSHAAGDETNSSIAEIFELDAARGCRRHWVLLASRKGKKCSMIHMIFDPHHEPPRQLCCG
jgi:hypothetical protein